MVVVGSLAKVGVARCMGQPHVMRRERSCLRCTLQILRRAFRLASKLYCWQRPSAIEISCPPHVDNGRGVYVHCCLPCELHSRRVGVLSGYFLDFFEYFLVLCLVGE